MLGFTPFGKGFTKPCSGFKTLASFSCVRGKITFVLSSFTSSLCSCVLALLVPVSNKDCPFFLLDTGMYQKTSVFGPFEGVTPFLVVMGLADLSSSLFEDGTASLSYFLGMAWHSRFLSAALHMDLISFGRASGTMSSSM
ncbi:hypothetical protein PS1_014649 [Malus domestica]